MTKYLGSLLLLYCLAFSNSVSSNIEYYFPSYVGPTGSNYGNTGILEMPNARFMEEASLRFNFSGSFPNEFTALTASPFDWFEATYRYTEIKDKKYGPSAYSSNQSFKDKGFDLKVRAIAESYYFPAVAIGFRDLAGTGTFGSEYIVATKKINQFDFTLGMGWGLLGTENSIENPFTKISQNFENRTLQGGQGGEFSYDAWFSGNTALFGGIEYNLSKYGLRLKLEYDTSNPDFRNKVTQVKNRFNVGADYSISDSLRLSASFERGDVFRIGFKLKGNFAKDTIPKPKPKNVVRLNKEQLKKSKENKEIFYRSLNKSLRDEEIYIQAANYNDDSVDVAIASTRFYSFTRSAGRTARIVSALSPEEIKRINIHSMNGDLEVAILSVNRDELDQTYQFIGSSNELLQKSNFISKSNKPLFKEADYMPKVKLPDFNWNMSPSVKHQIGGPEGFYLGQLSWLTDTTIKFKRNLSLYTSFSLNLYDTFNDLRNPSQSSIPRVRSDIQKYLDQGKNSIKRMKFEYMFSPMKDVYLRADFGILEEMFAGIGGEVLYRPFSRKSAFGLSLHKVKKRDFDQMFSLRNYETVTGHFSIYTALPRKIHSQISIGRYLARDKGITLDLSRRFNTGFTVGVFATKTNLSKEEFGEGSFDKGFYISVPTKLFYSDFRSGNISFGLHPLTKDGGAFLNQHNALFGILGDSNKYSINRDWDYFLR